MSKTEINAKIRIDDTELDVIYEKPKSSAELLEKYQLIINLLAQERKKIILISEVFSLGRDL